MTHVSFVYTITKKCTNIRFFRMLMHFIMFKLFYDNTFDRNSFNLGFFGFPKNSSGVPDSKI